MLTADTLGALLTSTLRWSAADVGAYLDALRGRGAATLAKMAVSGRAGAPPRGVVLYQQSRARRPL